MSKILSKLLQEAKKLYILRRNSRICKTCLNELENKERLTNVCILRLIEHPARDICRTVEEDVLLIDRKICEVVGTVVDDAYHKESFGNFYDY